MKTILSSLVVVVALVPSLSFADAQPSPSFASLPSGTVAHPPKDKAPARIPKTETVGGFYVADPPKTMLRDGKITQVIIFGSESEAKDFTAGRGGFGRSSHDDTCFSRRAERPGDAPEWSFDMEPMTRINAPWKPPPPPPKGQKPKPMQASLGEMEVTAVHQERFVSDGATKAHIDTVDAWVDPVTHGVRLIGRSTMPLERVATAPNGLTLYGAKADKQLHVVARREKPSDMSGAPSTPHDFRLQALQNMPLMIETSTGERDASRCGFARMALKAEKGAAEMAWFETQVVFLDEKKTDDDPTAPPQDANARVRPLRATVSSTWSTRDKEPVLSISFGWTGRERQM
jgi:hypothetical protein